MSIYHVVSNSSQVESLIKIELKFNVVLEIIVKESWDKFKLTY